MDSKILRIFNKMLGTIVLKNNLDNIFDDYLTSIVGHWKIIFFVLEHKKNEILIYNYQNIQIYFVY